MGADDIITKHPEIMAILDFIPSEYWAQLKTELNALDASELARLAANRGTTPAPRRETPAERSARIAAEYDAAIERRKIEMAKEAAAARRLTPEYKETQRRAAEKRKAIRDANPTPPKPTGRPRAPVDGLTPEQIAQREQSRQRSAEYRQRVKEAQERHRWILEGNKTKPPQSAK